MRALVIDDSSTIRKIVGGILRSVGFTTIEAADGRDALEKLGAPGDFQLAVTDWNMPEMNGLEFVKAVRADAAFAELPILMITTESEMDFVIQALSAGANEYVMKPFDREILLGKLEMLGLAIPEQCP